MLEIIVLYFSMQEEDIIKHTYAKCQSFTFLYAKEEDNLKHSSGKCHIFTCLHARGKYSWA